MKRKIIFFDADGTIVKGHFMSDKTKEAFKKLRENGHILVLSTGRALPSIYGVLKEMKFENIICSAGSCVVVNNEIVYKKPMKEESKRELVDYFNKNNIVYNMEANDSIYINKGHKEKYMRLFELPDKHKVSKEEYDVLLKHRETIDKGTTEIENIDKIEINKLHYYGADVLYDGECLVDNEKIKRDLGDKYKCISLSLSKKFSGGEISEKDVSKKVGMEVILGYFDVDFEDVFAIGDDYNDIEMLEFSKNSIAMGQAPEEVKKYATFITSDIDNDGFYNAMKHFKLI